MQWGTASIRVPDKPFLTLSEVSACVGYSTKTIQRWVKEGLFPEPKPVAGGGLRWSNIAVGAWLVWQQFAPNPVADGVKIGDEGDEDEGDEPAKPRPPGGKK